MSDYPKLTVVENDIGSQGGMPKSTDLARAGDHSVDELEADIIGVLDDLGSTKLLSDHAPDGSLAIPSMVSVLVLTKFAQAAGRPRLVNLSNVRREQLRSVKQLAQLIHSAFHPQTPVAETRVP